MTGIAINGRFLTGVPAATRLMALELTRALVRLAEARPDLLPPLRLIVPGPTGTAGMFGPGLSVDRTRGLTGNLWEQLVLPRAAASDFLVNFCARSPMLLRQGLTFVHDAQVFDHPESYPLVFRGTLRANLRMMGRRQAAVMAVSDYARSRLVARGITSLQRIHVVPNGVDHVLGLRPDYRLLGQYGLAPRGYAVGLANPQPHKNLAVLLRAFARPGLEALPLVLVGAAGRLHLSRLLPGGESLPSGLRQIGHVPPEALVGLLDQALVVLAPSFSEGFGLLPAEGLALGTPAIIAPAGALPETCGPGALHADPHVPEAWDHAINRLRRDPMLWRYLSERGQAHVARFRWAASAEILAGHLRRLVPPGSLSSSKHVSPTEHPQYGSLGGR